MTTRTKKATTKKNRVTNGKVLVTTAHRGVFFGTLDSRNGDTVVLKNGRNCIYWEQSVKGFIGLAVSGPSQGSRIGPACDSIELLGVTSIARCTPEAVEAWESAPWGW